MLDGVTIRSAHAPGVELAWFSALCADDYEFLGVPEPRLRSSWEHCRDIVLAAERAGFNNILLPSGYVPGQDPLTFAGGMAAMTREISLLVAVRCGEYHPPMLARAIARDPTLHRHGDAGFHLVGLSPFGRVRIVCPTRPAAHPALRVG